MRAKWFLVLGIIIVILSFMLVSCNIYEKTGISDKKNGETCKEKVNRLLDEGKYDEVLSTLNSTLCSSMSQEDRSINEAAAYLGKAGFSVPSLLKDILNATNSNGSGNKVSTFTRILTDKASGSDLDLITKAMRAYEGAGVNCTNPIGAEEENICFLKGITEIAKMGISTTLLFKSLNGTQDLNKIIDYWMNNSTGNCTIDVDSDTNPDSLQFSTCAMKFAVRYNSTMSSSGNLTNPNCGYQIINKNATFYGINGTFLILKLTISPSSNCTGYGNKTDYKLIENSTSGMFVVLTDGYCYASNRTSCSAFNNATQCYPCPVVSGNQTLTAVGTIVDSLNNGGTLIENVVQTSGTNETAVQDAITDFKQDFCKANPSQCCCTFANGTSAQCTNSTLSSAVDIKIGVCGANGTVTVNATTQTLLINYFTQ